MTVMWMMTHERAAPRVVAGDGARVGKVRARGRGVAAPSAFSASASASGRASRVRVRAVHDDIGVNANTSGVAASAAALSRFQVESTPKESASSEAEDAELAGLREALEDARAARDACIEISSVAASVDEAYSMKLRMIRQQPRVVRWISSGGALVKACEALSDRDKFMVYACVACGQAHVFSVDGKKEPSTKNARAVIKRALAVLGKVETFYDMMGGIVGYQCAALELCVEALTGEPAMLHSTLECDGLDCTGVPGEVTMLRPPGADLRANGGAFAATESRWGIEELPNIAEIYPLGGAGDRLGLEDPVTGESLPAAFLQYNGRPLIEGLFRDLTAREWLYYKLNGVHHKTPVAVMTSAAKGNHTRISDLLRDNNWYGRGEENFKLFEQPLVPVISLDAGQWVRKGLGKFKLKPGGHGAIWKLMYDEGVFDWLERRNRKGSIVRQITNPMAGTDTTLLSLAGVGVKGDKALGFASCERHIGASEGINVLVEKQNALTNTYSYGVSNIEYTELERLGLSDKPSDEGGKESAYPANTNVLYIGLNHIKDALMRTPRAAFPGMLINLTKPVLENGVKGGRLECSMQNIADALMRHSPERLGANDWDTLPTFVLFALRRRITSSAKKKRPPKATNLAQTPDWSFLDLLRNASDLLVRCNVAHPLPDDYPVDDYLNLGPEFIWSTNPSIGPLWDVVEQKIQGGTINKGSEVRLEIAEVEWRNVDINGALSVQASDLMGPIADGSVVFDDNKCGRCRLRNVKVINKGVDWKDASNVYWSASISRIERASIVIHGSGEFDAKDVTISGDVSYVVPSGKRLSLRPKEDGSIQETWDDIATPSWKYAYAFGDDDRVKLSLNEAR